MDLGDIKIKLVILDYSTYNSRYSWIQYQSTTYIFCIEKPVVFKYLLLLIILNNIFFWYLRR